MSTKTQLEALLPHCAVTHGHHLTGPGPAKYGWGATTAAGLTMFLGRGDAALERARELGKMFGGR